MIKSLYPCGGIATNVADHSVIDKCTALEMFGLMPLFQQNVQLL